MSEIIVPANTGSNPISGPQTANDEFADLMPHRIRVTGEGTKYDDWGKPITGAANSRVYMCLIDDTTTTARTADGTTITVALTAYVAPVPLGSTTGAPVNITSDEKVEVLEPFQDTKVVKSIERHYDSEDGVGMLHNIVLRFG